MYLSLDSTGQHCYHRSFCCIAFFTCWKGLLSFLVREEKAATILGLIGLLVNCYFQKSTCSALSGIPQCFWHLYLSLNLGRDSVVQPAMCQPSLKIRFTQADYGNGLVYCKHLAASLSFTCFNHMTVPTNQRCLRVLEITPHSGFYLQVGAERLTPSCSSIIASTEDPFWGPVN